MFKFLKLRNSVSGGARRHVPFRSIIHKPLFVLFALVFSFVVIVPIKVNAAAPQLHPEFKPIIDTDIVNFQDSYLNLDPAAQAAANILFGAYVTEYAGLADYGTVFDSVPTDGTVWDRLEFVGEQVVDTIFIPVNMADQLVLTPLINLGQGIVNKVKAIDDVQGFKDDILDASSYGLSYSPDIGFALNQLFAHSGGLYNWQYHDKMFSTFVWNTRDMNTTQIDRFNAAYNNFSHAVKFNSPQGFYNCVLDWDFVSFFNVYHNVFINTSNNTVSFVDDLGNKSNYLNVPFLSSTGYVDNDYYIDFINSYSSSISVSNLINQFFNYQFSPFTFNGGPAYLNGLNLVNFDFLYGNSFGSAIPIDATDDLGFIDTDSLQVLNPVEEAIFDLKALIEQIVQAQPDPALELPLKPIIYNITQVNGNPLTTDDLQGISFNVTPPESGINVPLDAFLPMFDNGKGFISYMWYMTKPLISYTRSLLDALTFDPVDGFNASGPGYFILGVAGLGLIGGVIVKFLL